MRPIKRELTADQHAEARRTSQIAHLAGAALDPLVVEYEADILDRLVGYVRARTEPSHQHVWAALGELAACRELRQRVERRKAMNPET